MLYSVHIKLISLKGFYTITKTRLLDKLTAISWKCLSTTYLKGKYYSNILITQHNITYYVKYVTNICILLDKKTFFILLYDFAVGDLNTPLSKKFI